MAEPSKIRAQLVPAPSAGGTSSRDAANPPPGTALVRVLMQHEMETGLRLDANAKAIPAWFIETVTVRHHDKPVLTVYCGHAVSKNPFLQFTLRGAKAGDKVSVQWADNRGDSRTDEAIIA
jgi:sulfur-oxidizing protein SoxZ